jgi:hypothetical protein
VSHIDDDQDGYLGRSRPLNEQTASYLGGQSRAREHALNRQRPLPPRPVTEGEVVLGRYFQRAIAASLAAAGVGALAALISGENVGEWAAGGGALTFTAFMAFLALLVGIVVLLWLLRVAAVLTITAVVIAAPAGLVLLALHAFGFGPGLSFL